jgi:peptidoglycan hydrolase-like protein with peptidoglycan-binding domain
MVTLIQILLFINGEEIEIDGSFGLKTKNVVKDFQKKNDLTVDGIVGKNTIVGLLS